MSAVVQNVAFEVIGNLIFWLLTVLCAAGGLSWFTQQCRIERRGRKK